MLPWVSGGLFVLALIGIATLVLQLAATVRHTRRPAPRARGTPGISILKPLCGLDDGLAESLAQFAALAYPEYQLLLGVRDTRDAAYPVALAAQARFPDRIQVVVQTGTPGRNPKVNQLITLAAAAAHDILVVSDSNTRVGPDYLDEIAAHFQDGSVGIVTHAIAGAGERRLGSLLDNLHMAAYVSPGILAAKRIAGKDIVIGKSMALRRADLDALGGFAVVKDVLAEDYVLGLLVTRELGKRVVVARQPICNLSTDRSLRDFYHRYRRWSVIHRQAIHPATYCAQALLNPLPLAAAAVILVPTSATLLALSTLTALKMTLDNLAALHLRGRGFGLSILFAVPCKDLILTLTWLRGFLTRQVEWRGNLLRVTHGTQIEGHAPPPNPPQYPQAPDRVAQGQA